MSAMLFALPGNTALAQGVADALGGAVGRLDMHVFPDGEVNPRFGVDLAGQDVVLACTLDAPNDKVLPLYLAAKVARELGARSVGLLIPYLAYMRQDARFHAGEGITSAHFASLLSSCADYLVTVDPHLHRHKTLGAIYSMPSRVVAAAPSIAEWIGKSVTDPLLVGPDEESAQWVAEVAAIADCPYTVLTKVRSGDRAVAVSDIDGKPWQGRTPVLIDDIASSARTLIAASGALRAAGLAPPVCIVVHALFAGDAYTELNKAGVARVVSCNTVKHASNAIDLHGKLAAAIGFLMSEAKEQS